MSLDNAKIPGSEVCLKPTYFDNLVLEFKKYISFIKNLKERDKTYINSTIEPFFVFSYLAMLKGKNADYARNFFSQISEQYTLIGEFIGHLNDLLQFETLQEARNHHYFQRISDYSYRVAIPKESLFLLMTHLQKEGCSSLEIVLLHLVGAIHRNNPNCSQFNAIQPAVKKDISETTKAQNPGTSLSLRNTDDDPNKPNFSQSTENPTVIGNEMLPKMNAALSKTKESSYQWNQNPETAMGVTNSCKDENNPSCSQSFEIPHIGIGSTKRKRPLTASSSKKKKLSSHWIGNLGTSSLLRNTNAKTDVYNVNMFHYVFNYGEFEVICADINRENTLFACGFENSTICVGPLDLEAMESEVVLRNEALSKSSHLKHSDCLEYSLTSNYYGLDHCLTGHSERISGLAFARDDILMSCSDDNTARAWRTSDFKNVAIYKGHRDEIRDIAVSDSGVDFATASIDCTARLWDFTKEIPVKNLDHAYEVERLRFDPNCRYLCTVSSRRMVQVWDLKSYSSVWTIPDDDSSYINVIRISPDGKHIAYADEVGKIKVWDLSSRKLYSAGIAHRTPIYDIAYNEDSTVIASCAGDRFVNVWDAKKSLHVSKKRGRWMHPKLAQYYARAFDPCFIRFYKNDFILTINSKSPSASS